MSNDFEDLLKKAEEKFHKVLDSRKPLKDVRKRRGRQAVDAETRKTIEDLEEKTKQAKESLDELIKNIKKEDD